MQQTSWLVRGIVAIGLAMSINSGLGDNLENGSATSYPGVTKPSEERSLAFSYPGVVREVFAREGERVKAGQKLMKLDDRMDRTGLEQLLIEANSPLKVEYAKQARDQKKVRYERLLGLQQKDEAASTGEVEEARLNAQLAVTQLSLSEEESQTAKLKAQAQAIKVEQAELKSTIDGIVRTVNVKEGEYADPQQSQRAACVVVKIDPLKVEVYLPANIAGQLKMGEELDVAYADSKDSHKAHVTYFDPVADAGSGLRRLWLEMPNPEGHEAGTQVQVKAPAK